jgi:hypothetical protein
MAGTSYYGHLAFTLGDVRGVPSGDVSLEVQPAQLSALNPRSHCSTSCSSPTDDPGHNPRGPAAGAAGHASGTRHANHTTRMPQITLAGTPPAS